MSQVTIDTNEMWDIGKESEATQKRTIELADALQGQVKSLTHIEDFIQLYDERLCRQIKRMKNEANRCGMAASYIFKIAENYEGVDRGMTSILTTLNVTTALTRSENDVIYGKFTDSNWLPPVMRFDGNTPEERYLKAQFDELAKKKSCKKVWTQDMINDLWKSCEIFYDAYGVRIDPRLLLSIILQEGTGSFNTSLSNKAADGQNGYEADFAKDLIKANNLIFGKLLGYIYYGEDFRNTVQSSNQYAGISGNGSFAQYANWNTPIISIKSGQVNTGVYAGHGKWYEGVETFYKGLTGDSTTMDAYSEYLSHCDKSIVEGLVKKTPSFSFKAICNAQDYRGNPNGQYTVSAK